MKPFELLQGSLGAGSTTMFTVPAGSFYSINTLRINNPAAYDFTLTKYKASTASTVDIYSLSLAAGDIITDTYLYMFDPGDQLILTSSVAGTNYYITLVTT